MTSQTSDSTSRSLIRLVQENDAQAWTKLSQLYTPLAYGWCRQSNLQDADISDIVQNVFTSVHKSIANFRHNSAGSTFRGWLWTITRNEVRTHYRRRAGKPQAAGGTDAHQAIEQIPAVFDAQEPPATGEEEHFLHRALRMIQPEFGESTWNAFWRTTVDDQSAAEVAEELGMTAGAVRQAKFRVLSRLRSFLADD